MILHVRHMLYEQIRSIHDDSSGVRYRWRHRLEMAIFGSYIIRWLTIMVMFWLEDYVLLWHYDYIAYMAVHHQVQYATYFGFTRLILDIFLLTLISILYFQLPGTLVLQIYYQVTVLLTDLYRECLRVKPRGFINHMIDEKKHTWDIIGLMRRGWHKSKLEVIQLDQLRFQRAQVSLFPRLAFPVRLRLLVTLNFMDYLTHFTHFFFVPVLVIFYFFILQFTGFWCHGTLYRLFVLVDLFVFLCATMLLIQLGLLIILMSILLGQIFYHHVRYCAQMLRRAMRINLLEMRPEAKLHLRYCIKLYLTEQTRISRLYLYSNKQFWSRCLLAFFLGNLPVNIYIVSRVLWDQLTQFELFSMGNLFVGQLIGGTVILLPHIISSRQLHQSDFIPQLQLQMARSLIHLKLKCDTLLQRVSSNPRYEMTIGSFRTVNYISMLELLALYVSYFIFISSIKLHL